MEACRKCGKCCSVLAIRVPVENRDLQDFFSARGLKQDEDDPEVILIPSICQYLTHENLCNVYNVRPEICKKFPVGGYIPKGCYVRDKSAP